jgi:putative transposase
MPKKRFSAEQIVTLLRQIEVSMAQGKPTPMACRDAGISQQSYATSGSMERSSTA